MNPQEEVFVHCPYCDEAITLLIDCSATEQQYTEDCFVCCRPMVVSVQLLGEHEPSQWNTIQDADHAHFENGSHDQQSIQVIVQREDDAFG